MVFSLALYRLTDALADFQDVIKGECPGVVAGRGHQDDAGVGVLHGTCQVISGDQVFIFQAVHQFLQAWLVDARRYLAGVDGVYGRLVYVHPDDAEAPAGEDDGQGQAQPPDSDDGNVLHV